jgi:hypothetical protein
VQREVAAKKPPRDVQGADHRLGRAEFVDDRVPVSAVVVLPVTDDGCALILVAAERARDFLQKPVYLRREGLAALGRQEGREVAERANAVDRSGGSAIRSRTAPAVDSDRSFQGAEWTKRVRDAIISEAPCAAFRCSSSPPHSDAGRS